MKTVKGNRVLVENCIFKGIEWDKSSVEVVLTVAKGLLNLTELFKSQNIQIETLLKICKED